MLPLDRAMVSKRGKWWDQLLAPASGHLSVRRLDQHSEIETVPLLVLPMVLRMDSSTDFVSVNL